MPATTAPAIVPDLKLSSQEIAFYKREGYLYIPGLIDREAASALRREVVDVLSVQGLDQRRMSQAKGTADKLRQTGEYLAGSTMDGFINSANLADIAGQLMGGPSTLYLPFSAVKAGGGGGRFHFHQDNQYTRYEDGLLGINLWFALAPITPENGCLQVVPRSHLKGTLESQASSDGDGHRMTTFEPDEFLPLRMQPGDCVAFSRLTVHGSGPNTTGEARIAYAVQFHRDDAVCTVEGKRLVMKETPRWRTGPVERITPPKASVDGH